MPEQGMTDDADTRSWHRGRRSGMEVNGMGFEGRQVRHEVRFWRLGFNFGFEALVVRQTILVVHEAYFLNICIGRNCLVPDMTGIAGW